MTVEQIWPTCISLAIFGLEKSMTNLLYLSYSGGSGNYLLFKYISVDN